MSSTAPRVLMLHVDRDSVGPRDPMLHHVIRRRDVMRSKIVAFGTGSNEVVVCSNDSFAR
ncbi:MAG: hypothetical protein ACKOFW_07640 [Planctomycetaceae bacterium]